MTRQEELESEGWKKTLASSGRRLRRFVELYEESGFEVHLEPMSREDLPSQCEGCLAFGGCHEYQVIYVRPKKGEADSQANNDSA